MNLFALLAVTLALGAAQPPPEATTDVDAATTPVQASPLAPADAVSPTVDQSRSLDDILSAARPVETQAAPAEPEEAPRPGVVVTAPATSPTATAPTFIHDRNSRPDGPPTESDILYETRVLGAFRTAQDAQGPLDGRWLVAKPGGEVIYALQLADPGAGDERIEGAWRNVKLAGLGGSGFIEEVRRQDGELVIRFRQATTSAPDEVRVRPTPEGGWRGLATNADGLFSVVMSRDQGIELAARAVPAYVQPAPAPAKPAATCRRVKQKGKWRNVCTSTAKAKASSSKKKPAAKASSKKKKKR